MGKGTAVMTSGKPAGAVKIKVGPYIICQQEMMTENKHTDRATFRPVPDRWVLPGGRVIDTHELHEIAAKNGWRMG
jgi:hypothetical protein